jgi:hypothetical protein
VECARGNEKQEQRERPRKGAFVVVPQVSRGAADNGGMTNKYDKLALLCVCAQPVYAVFACAVLRGTFVA